MASRAVAPGPGPVRGRSDASGRASGRRLRRLGPCYACRNWETRFGAFLARATQVYKLCGGVVRSCYKLRSCQCMIACGDFDAFCDSGDMMPVATITVTKMMM